MIIRQKTGNIKDSKPGDREIDHLELEWYETQKRILHKKTNAGREISLKFMAQNQQLTEGDILHENENVIIVVSIKPCEAMVISPASMYEMAYICYEIGNKHLPLFFENDELLAPYELPLLKLLQASGFQVTVESRKLIHQLKTSVSSHAHTESKSLFSKILQLTSPNE